MTCSCNGSGQFSGEGDCLCSEVLFTASRPTKTVMCSKCVYSIKTVLRLLKA